MKRKQRQDLSYWPSHTVQSVPRKKQYTKNKNTVNKPITPESPSLKNKNPETKDTLGSIIYINTTELRSTSQHKSKPDIHSTTFTMDKENILKSKNIYYRLILTSSNREQTESPPMPKEYLTKGISFLDIVHQIVNIIYLLNKHLNNLPDTIHQRIL